jgi:hypothetical protein
MSPANAAVMEPTANQYTKKVEGLEMKVESKTKLAAASAG